MIFDSEPPKPKTGIRKYIPLPLLIILIVVAVVIAYFALHNLPEKHAVEHFLTELKDGNYKEAYTLWQPASDYSYQDFLQDWGPQGDYGKIREFRIDSVKSKGNEIVIVTITINNQTPPLSLVVTRKTKGLAYSPF